MTDPKTTFDLMASILASGKRSVVTETVRAQVKAATGYDLAHFGFEIVPDSPASDAVLSCVRWVPGEELVRPGNKTALCDWGCGHHIQFSGHWPDDMTKVCLQCVDQRPVKDS